MNSFLINEKFIKDKIDFLLRFTKPNIKINFFSDEDHICNFYFTDPVEKFYKNKTLLIFSTEYDYTIKSLKVVAEKYFYSNAKIYVLFNKIIDTKAVNFTKKIELNSENFDINFFDDKVQFLLLIDKNDF